jgi:hypothetical protein
MTTSSTMRSVFIAATVCWNLSAVTVGIIMGLYSLSHSPCGWLSLAFASVTVVQGILGFFKLKQSLSRYVRFGLTSAAFSRTPAKVAIAWMLTSLAGLGLYVAALVSFINASSSTDPDEARAGRIGVVWYSILGITMISLLVGMFVVSRISPYLSSWFVQTPAIPEEPDEH